jgi:hypothetical protein
MSVTEPALIREELVEMSVMRCITLGLPDYGYILANGNAGSRPPDANVWVREAFPTPEERSQELTITTVAFGFNIDDGGEAAELGSNLTRYVHTLVAWVFALEPRFGRRLAHTLKNITRRNLDLIPLLDFNQTAEPQVAALNVMRTQVRHEVNNSPRPWDQYVWTCAVAVSDTYYPE